MRRTASALASSALSRALLRSLDGVVARHRLLLLAATSSADRRWYSSGGSTKAAFVGLAVSAAGAASFFQEAYAKEPPSPELVPKDVVLYQYEACPFCNKVKAFLDYYDIPYKVVEVNPLSKKEIKWSDYKKVPILVVDGEQLVDSSAIIDKLGEKITPKKFTSAVIENDEEKKWRQWVDSHLVHILSPNIYRNTSEALESFDYITSNGNYSYSEKFTVKYVGAAAMYFVSKKLKKKYNISDERAALYEAAETWVKALDGRDFLGGTKPNIADLAISGVLRPMLYPKEEKVLRKYRGGTKPNLADLAVFGVLRPIRYLRSGKDMVEHTRIGEWYKRMETVVGESSRIKA